VKQAVARRGILTAEEIASLDLSAANLVVLSACDTGVGQVKAGEGVLGLRRAFSVAGAGSLIMSLWPVADQSTLRWMNAMYTSRLSRNQATDQAVQSASVAVLDWCREEFSSGHPFYWAGFIATGDWR